MLQLRGEHRLAVVDAIHGALFPHARRVVRRIPLALARVRVDAIGFPRLRVHEILPPVPVVRRELVRQIHLVLDVRYLVSVAAQRAGSDALLPLPVIIVVEKKHVQLVPPPLPPVAARRELELHVARLRHAELADELLGGHGVDLERALLHLGERGRARGRQQQDERRRAGRGGASHRTGRTRARHRAAVGMRGVGRDGRSFAKGSRATPEPRLEPGRRGGGPRDPCSADARVRIAAI